MKKITLVMAVLFAICYTRAQTSLAAGDIAFLGSNTDLGSTTTDNVSFVLLKDIDAATQIIFTSYQSGVKLADKLFEFTVPDGVDVIGFDE